MEVLRLAILSILGLYKYDSTIFDSLQLPDGVDKNTLVNRLIFETAELECLMSSPSSFSYFIGAYSAARLDSWRRMAETLAAKYNPLHNYDRYEEWTDKGSGSSSGSVNNSGEDVSKLDRSAFNSDKYEPAEKSTIDHGAKQNTSSSASNQSAHSGHLYGNIGVTTSQQMMMEELNIRDNDIYKKISDDIKQHFCILVY